MPEKRPAPGAPSPAPPPAAPPANTGAILCPGCDAALGTDRYCATCDGRVNDDGDLEPEGLRGRVARLEESDARTAKVARVLERGLGIDLDAIDPETFGVGDVIAAVKKKAAEDPNPERTGAQIKDALLGFVPEELRGLLG